MKYDIEVVPGVIGAWHRMIDALTSSELSFAVDTSPTDTVLALAAREADFESILSITNAINIVDGMQIVTRRGLQPCIGIFDLRHTVHDIAWLTVNIVGCPDQKQCGEKTDVFGINVPTFKSLQATVATHQPKKRKIPFLFQRLLTEKYNQPAFFTVMGPEGVGKTTACGMVAEIYSRLPIPMRMFHHTAHWKGDGNQTLTGYEATVKSTSQSNEPHKMAHAAKDHTPRSTAYRVLRTIWRGLVPDSMKRQLLAVPGELQYMDHLTGMLCLTHMSNEIALSDRYCYDRYVRWLNLDKPFTQRLLARIQCTVMRRPLRAFVLTDTAERIFARKESMPKWEIEKHQSMLISVCTKYGVPFDEIDLEGRDAATIATIIANRILRYIGPDIFDLIEFPKTSGSFLNASTR